MLTVEKIPAFWGNRSHFLIQSPYFLLLKILAKRVQSMPATRGIIKKGRTMLRYLTIAPRLFTLNPIESKTEKEKKMQNQINPFLGWIFNINNRYTRKRIRRRLISVAAAKDNRCFTSLG